MNVISKIRSVITLFTFVIVFLVVDSAFEIKRSVFENKKDGGDLCCCVMQFHHVHMFLFKKIVFHRFFYTAISYVSNQKFARLFLQMYTNNAQCLNTQANLSKLFVAGVIVFS